MRKLIYNFLAHAFTFRESEANKKAVCLKDKKKTVEFLESVGRDLDNRGLHWGITPSQSAPKRLAFCLAAHAIGAYFVHVDQGRIYINVETIAKLFSDFESALKRNYELGSSFFLLATHLGYEANAEVFELLKDLPTSADFLEGFSARARTYCSEQIRTIPHANFALEQQQRRDDFIYQLSVYMEARELATVEYSA